MRKLGRFLLVAASFGLVVEAAGLVSGNEFSLLDAAALGLVFTTWMEASFLLRDRVRSLVARFFLYAIAFALVIGTFALVHDNDNWSAVTSLFGGIITGAGLVGLDVLAERTALWAERQRERIDAERG